MPRESSSGLLRSLKAKRSVFSQSMEMLWRYWSASVSQTCRDATAATTQGTMLITKQRFCSLSLLSQWTNIQPSIVALSNVLRFLFLCVRGLLFPLIQFVLQVQERDFIVISSDEMKVITSISLLSLPQEVKLWCEINKLRLHWAVSLSLSRLTILKKTDLSCKSTSGSSLSFTKTPSGVKTDANKHTEMH